MFESFWMILLGGLLLMCFLMAVLWIVGIRIRNFGIVDIAWAAGFSAVAVLYAVLSEGYTPRRWIMAGMAVLWSLRLTVHLYVRIVGHHPVEDGRYRALRREWAEHLHLKFFWFFQFQAALVSIFSVPFLLACQNPNPRIALFERLGAALWGIALAGESLADRQLSRFKSDPAGRGKTCQVGLWRYSRHPNYFFEWLIWCAYFLFALAAPWGWVTVYCPLLMLYFLFRLTGIPMTEEQSLRSRGDEYRRYQETTSVFVPWFRKKA